MTITVIIIILYGLIICTAINEDEEYERVKIISHNTTDVLTFFLLGDWGKHANFSSRRLIADDDTPFLEKSNNNNNNNNNKSKNQQTYYQTSIAKAMHTYSSTCNETNRPEFVAALGV